VPLLQARRATLAALEKEYGDKVKFVWRNMPLPFHADARWLPKPP